MSKHPVFRKFRFFRIENHGSVLPLILISAAVAAGGLLLVAQVSTVGTRMYQDQKTDAEFKALLNAIKSAITRPECLLPGCTLSVSNNACRDALGVGSTPIQLVNQVVGAPYPANTRRNTNYIIYQGNPLAVPRTVLFRAWPIGAPVPIDPENTYMFGSLRITNITLLTSFPSIAAIQAPGTGGVPVTVPKNPPVVYPSDIFVTVQKRIDLSSKVKGHLFGNAQGRQVMDFLTNDPYSTTAQKDQREPTRIMLNIEYDDNPPKFVGRLSVASCNGLTFNSYSGDPNSGDPRTSQQLLPRCLPGQMITTTTIAGVTAMRCVAVKCAPPLFQCAGQYNPDGSPVCKAVCP